MSPWRGSPGARGSGLACTGRPFPPQPNWNYGRSIWNKQKQVKTFPKNPNKVVFCSCQCKKVAWITIVCYMSQKFTKPMTILLLTNVYHVMCISVYSMKWEKYAVYSKNMSVWMSDDKMRAAGLTYTCQTTRLTHRRICVVYSAISCLIFTIGKPFLGLNDNLSRLIWLHNCKRKFI